MKVLLLHGFLGNSQLKKDRLEKAGFSVCRPCLSDISFRKAVLQAQEAFDSYQPDLIIGSSRGGAIALKIKTSGTPMILMAPAWKRWGKIGKTENPVTIIHGKHDVVISQKDSEELSVNSPNSKLLIVDDHHRLTKTGAFVMMKTVKEIL